MGRLGYLSIFFAALISSASVAHLAAQASGSVEDSVRALESQRAQALLKADTVALSQLVADDFVEISRLGMLRTKADNMREIASGTLRLTRSEEHTSELQSPCNLVCRLLLEKKKKNTYLCL